MHEMGIVIHLAKTLNEMAEENHITKFGSVTLQVGEVSGIVNDLFLDFWSYYRDKQPLLVECEMKIEPIEAITHCDECGQNYPTVKYGRTCPYCNSEKTWLITGNETIIKEVEAETADENLVGTTATKPSEEL